MQLHKTQKGLPENIRRNLYKHYGSALADKKYRPAIALFERYRKRYFFPIHQKYQLGVLYDHLAMMREGKISTRSFNAYLSKAEEIYRTILKEDPSYFHAWYGIGRIYNVRKMYKKGLAFQIRAYHAMMKLPREQRGALAIGRTYENIGDYKNAEAWYLRELRDGPRNDFGATLNVFMFYKNRGQQKRALHYATKVEKLLKEEYRKKIYKGLNMQNSQFVRYIKSEIKKVRQQ